MELFAADGHDAGECERVTGKSGMRPWEVSSVLNDRQNIIVLVRRGTPVSGKATWAGRCAGRCRMRSCSD